MENRNEVHEIDSIIIQFRKWKNIEALKYGVLEKLIRHSKSKSSPEALIVALIAESILFSIFVFNKASRDGNDPRTELAEKTTAEITRDVLDDMQLPHPTEQKKVLEQTKPDEVRAIEEPIPKPQPSSVRNPSSEHVNLIRPVMLD